MQIDGVAIRNSPELRSSVGRTEEQAWPVCCRSMSDCRATSSGAAGPCTPASGRRRSRARAWCGGSTSMATARAISPATAASNAPCFVYQIESYRYWQKRLGRNDFAPRAVRRELHRRGTARRRGLHRRPLPDRRRAVRGDPAARHLLPGRHSHGRAADGRAADLQRPAGLLLSRPRGRRRRRRRRDRPGRARAGADDRRRDQRAALFARASPRSARARAANSGAVPGLAAFLRGAARSQDGRRGRETPGLVAGGEPRRRPWRGFRPLRVARKIANASM